MAILKIPLLGKEAIITAYDVDDDLLELYKEKIIDEAKRLESIFNFYDPVSELSELNKKRKKKCSAELIYVLKEALAFCAVTEGAYDISKGKNFLERKSGKPLSMVGCSYKNISIDSSNKNVVTYDHPDVLVDLGSIAKGYIGDKLALYLQEIGIDKCLVDVRGDIRIINHEEKVGIQHPREKNMLLYFKLNNAAVATSGDYTQYVGDYAQNHILNATECISATVIADILMKADVIATCLMVMKKESRAKFLESLPVKACLVNKDLKIDFFNQFESLTV